MFTANEIDPREQPDSVRKRNEIFKGFTAAVFATHYRRTKAKLGLSGIRLNDIYFDSVCKSLGFSARLSRNDDEDAIIDLGTYVRDRSRSPPLSQQFPSNQEPSAEKSGQKKMAAQHTNPPCWTWVYTDHEKKKILFVWRSPL